ncbi:MAG: hypothetical protein C4K48_10010 [Candidatus Thorarchaeota archaeon]|nr:MAG: hypothetical protein C4K48_10010 [Candidatus Thorarchaeota archaeon]
MKQNQLTLVARESVADFSESTLTDTLTESLWDITKNHTLNIILREPALLELASRRDPGVIVFCDYLLHSEDQECWFSALKALEALNTYEAAQRLLILCGDSGTGDRKIVLNVLARVLTSSQREGFRRLLRSILAPGELDISRWTSTALRVLESVCHELGILLEDTTGKLYETNRFEAAEMQFGTLRKNKRAL